MIHNHLFIHSTIIYLEFYNLAIQKLEEIKFLSFWSLHSSWDKTETEKKKLVIKNMSISEKLHEESK